MDELDDPLNEKKRQKILKKLTESWIICFRNINKQLLQKK